MNGHSLGVTLADRLDGFRKSDAERDSMISDVVARYEELHLKYVEKCDDLNNEVESRRMWQTKASTSLKALNTLQGSNSFVLVILDGDGAIFQDYLYAMGREGGMQAAHTLHSDITTQLNINYPDSNVADWTIVVHVVLNLQGLSTKLQSCGIISNPNEILAFGRAFSLAQPMFSFIDVGSGKERADHKIRETLRLFLPIAQCKHVFFGPCHDNGYLPVLESYRRDAATASRLTLIETTPAEPGFTSLGLPRVRFPRVFRSDQLPARPITQAQGPQPISSPQQVHAVPIPLRTKSTNMTMSSVPIMPKSISPAPSVDPAVSSSTWAMVGKPTGGPKNISIVSNKKPVKSHILLNAYDERVDLELPKTDLGAEKRFSERFKKGKCCNNHHLGVGCESGEYCDYVHGERLPPGELLVLKHKARSLCCPSKLNCKDFNCYLGHHCRFGRGCFYESCRFDGTHGTELTPAKKLYEDGNEEWLASYLSQVRA